MRQYGRVFAFLSVLITSVFLVSTSYADADSALATATVIKVTGKVLRGQQELKAGDKLMADDEVVVGEAADSSLDLKSAEGHRFRFKAGSRFKLNAVKAKVRMLNLLSGKVFVQFVKSSDATPLEVHTKSAVAGVRGTRFVTEYVEKKGTYFCVCEGKIEVRKIDGTETTPIAADQDLWIKPEKALGKAVDSPQMSKTSKPEFETMNY